MTDQALRDELAHLRDDLDQFELRQEAGETLLVLLLATAAHSSANAEAYLAELRAKALEGIAVDGRHAYGPASRAMLDTVLHRLEKRVRGR